MLLRNVLAMVFMLTLLVAAVWFAAVIIVTQIPFESVDGLVWEHDLQFHYYSCHQGYSLLLVDNLSQLDSDDAVLMKLGGGSQTNRHRDLLGKLTITCREEKSITLHLPSPEGTREITVKGDYTLETSDPDTAKLTINNKSFAVTGDMIVAIDFNQDGLTAHKIDANLSQLAIAEGDSTSQLEAPAIDEIEDYILGSQPILDVLVRKKQHQK